MVVLFVSVPITILFSDCDDVLENDCFKEKYSPVCGSDDSTYWNTCALKKAKCKGEDNLKVQYETACKGTTQINMVFIH